jgi:type IV secretory pathway VirB2 component (pilin)
MFTSVKSLFLKIAAFGKKHGSRAQSALIGMGFLAALLAVPTEAMAAVDLPFVSGIGCTIVQYLKGPMAVVIFMIVLVATLVVGMISKMDWGKIIGVVVIFGMLQGLTALLMNSGYINIPSCMM